MKIHSWVSRKKYLHNKAAYEYERFCVPVPKRLQSIVKPSQLRNLITLQVFNVKGWFIELATENRAALALKPEIFSKKF